MMEWEVPEGAVAFLSHHRMGSTCHFGPFNTRDEIDAWLVEHPQVRGVVEFMYLDVDWSR